VLGQHHELLIQHLQALPGDFVRIHVVDADLKVVEAGAVQPPDALRSQQVAVGDQACKDPVAANLPDQYFEFGMEQRLAPAERNDRDPERGQPVNAP
jgi:hypothetical protein